MYVCSFIQNCVYKISIRQGHDTNILTYIIPIYSYRMTRITITRKTYLRTIRLINASITMNYYMI